MNSNEELTDSRQAVAVSRAMPEKRFMRFIWPAIFVALVAALIVMLIRDTSKSGLDGIVGEAAGVKITKADLYEEMLDRFGQMGYTPGQLVDTMVTDRLVEAEIAKAGVSVTDAELDAEIEEMTASFGSRENFESAMTQYGYTLDTLKEEMKLQLQLEKIIEPMIDSDEATIHAYYDENKDLFATSPEQVRASHILLETKEEAESVLQQLEGGADFADLAGAVSRDPGSKDRGGDLDYFGRGAMHAEFEEAAFALAPGETSGVVESPSGFHVIRVTDRKEAQVPPYDEIREEVRSTYMSEQMQSKSMEWIAGIKEDAGIRNYLLEE